MPQPRDRPPVPLPAYVDQKMADGLLDGYRYAELPPQGEAWQRGLAALDAAALEAHGAVFHALAAEQQDGLLRSMQQGSLTGAAWRGMPCKLFFRSPGQSRHHPCLSRPPRRLERDRLWRSRRSARLCAHGTGPARSVGGRRSRRRTNRWECATEEHDHVG